MNDTIEALSTDNTPYSVWLCYLVVRVPQGFQHLVTALTVVHVVRLIGMVLLFSLLSFQLSHPYLPSLRPSRSPSRQALLGLYIITYNSYITIIFPMHLFQKQKCIVFISFILILISLRPLSLNCRCIQTWIVSCLGFICMRSPVTRGVTVLALVNINTFSIVGSIMTYACWKNLVSRQEFITIQ